VLGIVVCNLEEVSYKRTVTRQWHKSATGFRLWLWKRNSQPLYYPNEVLPFWWHKNPLGPPELRALLGRTDWRSIYTYINALAWDSREHTKTRGSPAQLAILANPAIVTFYFTLLGQGANDHSQVKKVCGLFFPTIHLRLQEMSMTYYVGCGSSWAQCIVTARHPLLIQCEVFKQSHIRVQHHKHITTTTSPLTGCPVTHIYSFLIGWAVRATSESITWLAK